MCEVKPGPRCAADTRAACDDAATMYAGTHPDGPDVNALDAASAAFDGGEEPSSLGRVFDFPAWRVDEAIARIDKANKRLERAGVEDRFTYDVEEYVRTIEQPNGVERHEPYAKLTLSEPQLSFGGYRFLAAVDREEGGLITRTAPGVDLAGWRPEDMVCEQCGRKQHRGKTYIVEGEDGQRKQLGTSCVDVFLGVKPAGLWALEYDPLSDLEDDDDSHGGSGASWSRQVQPVKETLALALALSNGGKDFMSRSRAQMYGHPVQATSDLIDRYLYGDRKTPAEIAGDEETTRLAKQYLEDGTVDKLMGVVRDEVDPTSDWGGNLNVVMGGEWVSNRQVGLLASSLTVWQQYEKKQIEAKAPKPAAGFTGPVGHKLKGEKATVTKVRHIQDYDPYSRRDVTKSFVVMRDSAGHEMTWYASGRQNLEAGQTITFMGGTVKDHGSYEGVDQTKLTRVKWELDAEQ